MKPPRQDVRPPTDLLAGLGYLFVAGAILLYGVEWTVARVVVGLPLVLFVPGYTVVSALFPERAGAGADHWKSGQIRNDRSGIDGVERVVLSVAVSIAVVPAIVGVLVVSGAGISAAVLVTALVLFSTVALLVSAVRRKRTPAAARYDPSIRAVLQRTKEALFETSGTLGVALTIAVLLSVVVTIAALGSAALTPAAPGATSMALVTENETGDYVASGYPETLSADDSAELVLRVTNQEGRDVEFTVVVQRQRLDEESGSVVARQELMRFQQTVANGDTWYADHEYRPNESGERLRLTYLLYRGAVPPEPSVETAYRHTYITIDVEEA